MNKLHNIMTGRVESDSFYPEIIRRLTYVIEDVLYPDLSQSLENMMRPKYSPLEKVQGILVADGNIILEPLKRQWDDAIEMAISQVIQWQQLVSHNFPDISLLTNCEWDLMALTSRV